MIFPIFDDIPLVVPGDPCHDLPLCHLTGPGPEGVLSDPGPVQLVPDRVVTELTLVTPPLGDSLQLRVPHLEHTTPLSFTTTLLPLLLSCLYYSL